MSGDLKTVLVYALNDAVMKDREEFFSDEDADLGADRLATAIRDHFLDRAKLEAIILAATGLTPEHREEVLGYQSVTFDHDDLEILVDRLIEGLAGKAGDA